MQKEQKKIKEFKKVFEETANFGFNPMCASMTTSDFDYEGYTRYCKSRLNVIKRGEDLVFQMRKVVDFVIEKINK